MGASDHMTDLTEEQKGDIFILRIKGRLDAVSSPQVEKRIFEAIYHGQSNLVLDVAGVNYLSSAGMRMLLSITKKLRTVPGKLIICGVTANVIDVLKMSGFNHALHLEKTEEDALKCF